MSAQNSVLAHIAKPYASALFDVARDANQLETVEQGLIELSLLTEQSPDFSRFLRSPVISGEDKAVAADAILARANANGLVTNLVKVIARNGRLFALPAVITAFRELSAAARGEVTAEVTSATALTPDQRQNLSDTLKARIGKTVTLNEHVDASLIGGLVVKVGSQMIDSSLKTKLTAMKIAMKEVG